jgi:hypothetical protein
MTGPSWLSIDSTTGLISGTAPAIAADTPFAVVVRVSDGEDSVAQSYVLTVIDMPITSGRGRGGGGGHGIATIVGDEFEEQQYLNQFNPIRAVEEETTPTKASPSALKVLLVLFWILVFVLLVALAVVLARRLRG